MTFALFANIIAAVVVLAYSIFRVHVLRWLERPLAMVANIIIACGEFAVLVLPFYGFREPSVAEVVINAGLAVSAFANWNQTECHTPQGKRVLYHL